MHQFTSCHGPAASGTCAPVAEPFAAACPDIGRGPIPDATVDPGPAPPLIAPLIVPKPRRVTRVDWARIVQMVGAGRPVAEVAREAGCSPQHVRRIVRRARRPSAADSAVLVVDMNVRLSALRLEIVEGLARAVAADDPRVMLWLAERLGVGADRAARAGRAVEDTWIGPRR